MNELTLKTDFTEVINLIKKSRFQAMQAVNPELINLYWQIGEPISNRVEAKLELELDIAIDLQLKIKQASIWTYKAWTITDAFLERDASKELINRLERQSTDADVLKADVDAMVKNLRNRKRKMTRKLKWKVYSPEVKAEQSKAVEIANEQVEAIADKLLAEKETANKPQLAIVKSESVSKSKKTKK